MSNYRILILGASYGSLLASKTLFGGHSVKLVCLPEEANLINSEGIRVRLPVRARAEPVESDSRRLPGGMRRRVQWKLILANAISLVLRCRSLNMARPE